jgi:hypothetical protein
MPIVAVYDRSLLEDAARAEKLTAAQVRAILAAAPANWLATLTNYLTDPAQDVNGYGLAEFRKAFPSILNTGNDAADSFLVRVAVAATGGVSV